MSTSRYNLDEFIELAERIEAQGGEFLPDAHEFRFASIPDSKGNDQQVRLTACGEVSLFEIPYRSSVDESDRTVKVCAVDDSVALWPRFLP